jgi:hypothetical protein
MEVKAYYLAAVVNGALITLKVNLNPEGYEALFNWLTANEAVSQFDLCNTTFFKPVFFSEAQGLVMSTKEHNVRT